MFNFLWPILADKRFFPTVLIVLDVFAGARQWYDGDIRKTVYWFAAAALTTTVTW